VEVAGGDKRSSLQYYTANYCCKKSFRVKVLKN
jgi:hypothetical protein